jgi:hypothetical protein
VRLSRKRLWIWWKIALRSVQLAAIRWMSVN